MGDPVSTAPLAAILHEVWTCPHGHDRVPYPCVTLAGILFQRGVYLANVPQVVHPPYLGNALVAEGKSPSYVPPFNPAKPERLKRQDDK